jgi:hypothetical protein
MCKNDLFNVTSGYWIMSKTKEMLEKENMSERRSSHSGLDFEIQPIS